MEFVNDTESLPNVTPPPNKTQQLHDELERVEKEQSVLRNRLATLDSTHRWLLSEIKAEQKIQQNSFLAAKLSVLQIERNLHELTNMVFVIAGNCLRDNGEQNYSVEWKGDWTILARSRKGTTSFRVDERGDVYAQRDQVKEFNVFDVAFDELRSKVAQRMGQ